MEPKYEIPDTKNQHAFLTVKNMLADSQTPFLLGITGAGGAGKTTFARNIAEYFGQENCLAIDLDDYLVSREIRTIRGLTGYDPRSNNLALAREHLTQLLSGNSVMKPRYDHSTGLILSDEEVQSKSLIIAEGVTALYPNLVDLYESAIFLDATTEAQMRSRIERDVNRRGYSMDEAIALFNQVRPDYERYIEPTKDHADIVFTVDGDYVMDLVS